MLSDDKNNNDSNLTVADLNKENARLYDCILCNIYDDFITYEKSKGRNTSWTESWLQWYMNHKKDIEDITTYIYSIDDMTEALVIKDCLEVITSMSADRRKEGYEPAYKYSFNVIKLIEAGLLLEYYWGYLSKCIEVG